MEVRALTKKDWEKVAARSERINGELTLMLERAQFLLADIYDGGMDMTTNSSEAVDNAEFLVARLTAAKDAASKLHHRAMNASEHADDVEPYPWKGDESKEIH